ncbi:MAG: hypothetical protein HY548_00735, partial [Elusimicrobia bacterium]|nr:hypothetical protein [Elusimicrobiota bacterium]
VVLEEAEDTLFTSRNSVHMSMVNIPLAALTNLAKRYGIKNEAEFADEVRSRIAERLQSVVINVQKDVERAARTTYFGSRIIILGMDAGTFDGVIGKTITEVLVESGEKYKGKVPSASSAKFMEEIVKIPFFAASNEVYIGQPMPEGAEQFTRSQAEAAVEFFEAWDKAQLERLNALEGTPQYYREYDAYLQKRRGLAGQWARYFTNMDRKDPREWLVDSPREMASRFIEALLSLGYEELFARTEAAEKAAAVSPDLARQVETISRDRRSPGNIIHMDDQFLRDLRTGVVGDETDFFKLFHQGRIKRIPLYNYHTGHLPRQMGRLDRIYNPRRPQKTNFESLMAAMGRLEYSTADAQERLEEFKTAYRRYRTAMDEALLLAYRDPRMENVYKLNSIGEMVEADRDGVLDQWRAHLESKIRNHPSLQGFGQDSRGLREWIDQKCLALQEKILAERKSGKSAADVQPLQDELFELRQIQRTHHLLSRPGFFMAKRPIGDEMLFVRRDPTSQAPQYYVAFGEMNGGNAFFQRYLPDERDSVIHMIFLAYEGAYDEAEREGGWIAEDPMRFLSRINGGIRQVVTDQGTRLGSMPYHATAKVPVVNTVNNTVEFERMKRYRLASAEDADAYPRYGLSQRGEYFVKESARSDWRKVEDAGVASRLVPYETILSAGFVYGAAPIKAGRKNVLESFYRLDSLNAKQKATQYYEASVSDEKLLAELEAAQASQAAPAVEPPSVPAPVTPAAPSLSERLTRLTGSLFVRRDLDRDRRRASEAREDERGILKEVMRRSRRLLSEQELDQMVEAQLEGSSLHNEEMIDTLMLSGDETVEGVVAEIDELVASSSVEDFLREAESVASGKLVRDLAMPRHDR